MTQQDFESETFEYLMDKAVKEYPPVTQNNARQIIRSQIIHNANKMRRSPSETAAQKLEQVGIPVDYKASDAGEPPKHAQDE